MEELLKYLSTGGDIGIYVLLYFAWRFHDRVKDIEREIKAHLEADSKDFRRVNERLKTLEERT